MPENVVQIRAQARPLRRLRPLDRVLAAQVLAGLSELVGDEGTLTWGASGSTWTLALDFEATPDTHSS